LICTVNEGDPGACLDRCILENDPHRVVEAMAIAAAAVGARQGYVCIRAEYALAINRLANAIRHARRVGALGQRIYGTGVNFDLDIRLNGSSLAGMDESALLATIEGARAEPRPQPTPVTQRGLWGCPTLIANVETLASVPTILRDGPEKFAAVGSPQCSGTKVIWLAGEVRRAGLVEVPMGTTFRSLVFEIGGGLTEGSTLKAIHTGGLGGGCIPASLLDTPIDPESLAAVGCSLGSGATVVINQQTSMVELARYFVEHVQRESCGKCYPCSLGSAKLLQCLTELGQGHASSADLQYIEDLANMLKRTTLCALGQCSANPVLIGLRHFRDEFLACLKPAGEP
jgi:NADH:ubiquinone oxidoreductase subunit F (NADH-binding)